MLVLTRKTGQRIQIGPDISITIARVSGGQVRVAIEAPREIPVYRGEIADLGWREQRAAGNSAAFPPGQRMHGPQPAEQTTL